MSTDGSQRRVRAPKTAELIAHQLRSEIVRGILKPGDTLPPELVLGSQFGVSRPTLREAFRILENESLIVVRRGSRGGVQVSSPDPAVAARHVGLLLQMSGTTLADVYEARMVLEPAAVRMLAQRRTAVDLAALNSCVADLKELVAAGIEGADLDRWSDTAFRFHDLIMERAGNQTLAVLGGLLRGVVSAHMGTVVRRSADHAEILAQFRKTIRSFVKLVSLIEAKDADAAEQFWRGHMSKVSKSMLWGSFATESVVDLFN
ncbi:FadR/GntR family transcriptional regulator [Nocardia arizonensis]|uniref:FadR/GntR family transcriptional regulator n=1 Tax=Nocardia arizonensis TaxID=1141647 RepID=UPI001FD4F951|nr:FCD domain-containing protein [Nocardia arizonensis]